jgi:hypothetical protein
VRLAALAAASATAQQATRQGMQRVTHATRFTVRIENVSTPQTLKLSNGTTAPAPTAPGIWVVHTKGTPIFAAGRPQSGLGLEALAEDGNPSQLATHVAGAPLALGNGAPVRLVAPDHRGLDWVKWVAEIRVS